MPLDYYEEDSEPMAEKNTPGEETTEGEGDSGKTALVDSSICPGMKPGDEFTVRVDKVLDSGEYVLSYPEGSKTKEEPEPSMEEGMAPQGEMESVMG